MPDVKSLLLQMLSLLSSNDSNIHVNIFSLHCFLFILIQSVPECFQRSTFCVF